MNSRVAVEIMVSTDNEASAAPWWAIVDPLQNMACEIHAAARQITGPFFSREDAQNFLEATRYNFGKRAKVYCFSGCYSRQYANAYKDAERLLAAKGGG